jgi:hypothetical protein
VPPREAQRPNAAPPVPSNPPSQPHRDALPPSGRPGEANGSSRRRRRRRSSRRRRNQQEPAAAAETPGPGDSGGFVEEMAQVVSFDNRNAAEPQEPELPF